MNQGLLEQRFFEIGRCIYCDQTAEPLTDEHAVPYGLGGNTIVLNKACCEKCRIIASKCELNPIHDNWAEVRAALDFPSRRKELGKRVFPLNVELEDGSRTTLRLKGKETLGLVQFLLYDPPAFLAPTDYKSGIKVTGARLIGFGLNPSEFKKKHKIKSLSVTISSTGNNFEKMVIKMAYCLVIAYWGIDCFEKIFVLPTILNEKDDAGFWMGCDPEGRFVPPIGKQPGGFVPRITILENNSGERITVVSLKFFPASEAPEYVVVIGTLKTSFNPPE